MSAWVRPVAAAAVAAGTWALWSLAGDVFPVAIRFAIAFAVFTLGPGAMVALPVTQRRPLAERLIFSLGLGIFLGPMLAHVLALVGAYAAFPFLAAAAGGFAFVRWRRAGDIESEGPSLRAVAIVALVATLLGTATYANKLENSPRGVTVYGEYDAFDLTFYASISGELAQHVPAHMPYQSGHRLNYSYYAHFLIATIYRFADVPLLDLLFRYTWPFFLITTGLVALLFFRSVIPESAAVLGAVLVLIGSDLSWIVALSPPDTYLWDPVVWSSNFLSSSSESLLFNTWTPALGMIFAGLYASRRAEADTGRALALVAGLSFAALVQFKTFAYAGVIGGLIGAVVFAGPDSASRRRWMLTLVAAVLFATPYFIDIIRLYDDAQAYLGMDFFLLQRTMLGKLDIEDNLARFPTPVTLAIATVVFFIGGLGVRLMGVPGVIRAAWPGSTDPPTVRLTAWIILAAAAIPFVIVTRPYHQTVHFYMTTLFLMWLFVARALFARVTRPLPRAIAAAVVIALAAPTSIHFVQRKWRDRERPSASASRGEMTVARYLAGLDSYDTVLLHDRPGDPSLISILSGRHTVLAWSRYVRNIEERQRDIEHFFRSAEGDANAAWATLGKYGVTHVIERPGRDAIHADVLQRLHLVMSFEDVRLYGVQ